MNGFSWKTKHFFEKQSSLEEIQTWSTDALKDVHAIYSEIRLGQCARVNYFYNNNVQEEPSLSEQEIKKKRIQIVVNHCN